MATFGNTSIGAVQAHIFTGGEKIGCRFKATGNGFLTAIMAYLRSETGTVNVRAGIYNDNVGVPGSLFAESINEVSMGETPGWKTFNMSNEAIVGGIYYWLATHWQTNINYWYDIGVSNQSRFDNTDIYPGLDDPFGSGSDSNEEISIYGVFTPIGGRINKFNQIAGSGFP